MSFLQYMGLAPYLFHKISGKNFDKGGMVSGEKGAPMKATVHGGEVVIPQKKVAAMKFGGNDADGARAKKLAFLKGSMKKRSKPKKKMNIYQARMKARGK